MGVMYVIQRRVSLERSAKSEERKAKNNKQRAKSEEHKVKGKVQMREILCYSVLSHK